MLVTMPSTSSQYLQVPKIIPHRKSRSRSRSRSRSQPQEVVVPLESPPKEVFVSKARLQSPQAPAFETRKRPSPPLSPPQLQPPPQPSIAINIPQKRSMETNQEPFHPPPTASTTTTTKPIDPEPAPSNPSIPLDLNLNLNGSIYSPEADAEASALPPEPNDTTMSDAPPPTPPTPPLRQRIIGAWKLESYIAYPTPSSPIQRPTFPMTKNVTGFILYTPDGYMSAQMLIPGQQTFKRGEGEEPQWAEAGKRFFGYCGPYYISHEGAGREEVLRHTFQVCNLPGWIGDLQVRTHRFEEDGQVLVLGSEEPTEIKGDRRVPVLKWRRAKDNTEAVPPPPTPQIKISGPGEP